MTIFECEKQVMNVQAKPPLIDEVLADAVVSISTLKTNPAAVIAEARLRQVAILSRNKPVAYMVSPEVWEHVMDVFADLRLAEEAREQLKGEGENEVIDLDAYL